MIDFAGLAVLVVRLGPRLAKTAAGRLLALPGRNSIEVFSAHLLVVFAVLGLARGANPHFAAWQGAVILTLAIACLFLVAHFAERRRNRRRGRA